MLVLGASGAETVAAGRVVETLIGAAVGVLVNVAFPPAVRTRYAGQAVQRPAGGMAALLGGAPPGLRAASAPSPGPGHGPRPPTPPGATRVHHPPGGPVVRG